MKKKIIFSSGGTGGHIFPTIHLMNHFFNKGYEVLLLTDHRGNNFLKNYKNLRSIILKVDTPTNKNFLRKILSFFVIFYSIIKSIVILKREKPDLIFGFGGYVSFPISIASIFFKLPLVIYENNMVFGRANKFLGIFSKKILVARKIRINFPKKFEKKTHPVGPILNKDIINHSKKIKNINKYFSILILGGSQGAEIFGKIVPPVIKIINEKGIKMQIFQQCISSQKDSIAKFYEDNNIKNHVFDFNQNILDLILSTDLAITRCGASTTAELVQTSTPFIGVPLPNSIDDHQFLNAKYYEELGCCLLLDQKNFNTSSLLNLILTIINDKKKLEIISNNMKKNNNKNVYINIENIIKELI